MTISFKGHDAKGTVQVAPDPAAHNGDADWQAREAALRRIGQLQDSLVEAIERLGSARTDLDLVVAKLRRADAREEEKKKGAAPATPASAASAGAGAPANPLVRAARDLRRKINTTERRLFVPPTTKGIVDDRTALSRVQLALFSLDSSWAPPNATQRAELQQAEAATAEALQAVNRLMSEDVAAFHKQAAAAQVDLLPVEAPLELPPAP